MSQSYITYKQLLNVFEDFATKHKQIKSYAYSEPYDIINSGNNLYPAFWVQPNNVSVVGNQLKLSFYFLFADIINVNLTDSPKILSDMLTLALDFKAYMSKNFMFDIEVDANCNLTHFIEQSTDNVAGWNLQMNIIIDNYTDFCSVQNLLND
jgi:hypothetical protein